MLQLASTCFQVVQRPQLSSFQVPDFLAPDFPRGSRVIVPSGMKIILNLVPPGAADPVDSCSYGSDISATDAQIGFMKAMNVLPT